MRRQRIIAAAAVIAAGSLALTGCTAGKSNADTGAKLKSLSIMAPYLGTAAPADGNEIGAALDKELGVKLDINWVPNTSYEDKTNITLAGDEVPQVMVIQSKSPGFVKNAEAGAFWDLTDYLKDYPNLKTNLPKVQEAASVNGKVYGIFRARDVMREGVMIRKDWLTKLGLSMPKTTEDLFDVAKAFTEDDPDGNGKNDTYGLIVPKWPGTIGTASPWDAIETWYGSGNRWTTTKAGKLVPNFTTDEWLDAVQFEKKLVTAGVVNPDFATMDATNWNAPFLTGKGGIIIDTQSRAGQLVSLLKQQDPTNYQDYVDITGNLTGPDGTLHAMPTSGYSGFLAIPKSQVRTEAQLKSVLTVLNDMNSKKASILETNGIEGTTFTLDDGKAVAVPDVSATLKEDVNSYAQLGTGVTGNQYYPAKQPGDYEQAMYDKRIKIQDSDLKSADYDPSAAYVSTTYVSKGAQLDTIVSDARIKFIAGQLDLPGLKAAIKLWRTSGGDDVIAETNKLASASK